MLIHETSHWILKHRADSKLPGYLILAAKYLHTDSLSKLSCNALNELGFLQAKATEYLETRFNAQLVYICRWGHQLRIPEDLITNSGRHLITDSGVFDHFNDSR